MYKKLDIGAYKLGNDCVQNSFMVNGDDDLLEEKRRHITVTTPMEAWIEITANGPDAYSASI